MYAVADSIGTDESVFFISTNTDSNDALDRVEATIEVLGRVMAFKDDIGLGSFETLFFGLAGFELCIKLSKSVVWKSRMQASNTPWTVTHPNSALQWCCMVLQKSFKISLSN